MPQPKILVVEDNPINAIVTMKIAEELGEPILAVSDVEAFAQLDVETFALVLMDINLGGNSLDGQVIMERLRQQPAYRKLPFIAVTSYAMPEDRDRFLAAGFDAYIPKPIQRPVLLAEMRRCLGLGNNS